MVKRRGGKAKSREDRPPYIDFSEGCDFDFLPPEWLTSIMPLSWGFFSPLSLKSCPDGPRKPSTIQPRGRIEARLRPLSCETFFPFCFGDFHSSSRESHQSLSPHTAYQSFGRFFIIYMNDSSWTTEKLIDSATGLGLKSSRAFGDQIYMYIGIRYTTVEIKHEEIWWVDFLLFCLFFSFILFSLFL